MAMRHEEPHDDNQLGLFDTGLPDPTRNTYGMVRNDHPITSKKAAVLIRPKTGSQRDQILTAIANAYDGLTHEEMEPFVKSKSKNKGNTVRPRCGELVKDGWVKDSGRKRLTEAEGDSIVWVLTDEGRTDWDSKHGKGT